MVAEESGTWEQRGTGPGVGVGSRLIVVHICAFMIGIVLGKGKGIVTRNFLHSWARFLSFFNFDSSHQLNCNLNRPCFNHNHKTNLSPQKTKTIESKVNTTKKNQKEG